MKNFTGLVVFILTIVFAGAAMAALPIDNKDIVLGYDLQHYNFITLMKTLPEELPKERPNNPAYSDIELELLGTAADALNAGDRGKAFAVAAKVLQKNPLNMDAYVILAADKDRLPALLEEAGKLDNQAPYMYLQAKSFIYQRDAKQAEQICIKAINELPEAPFLHALYGTLFYSTITTVALSQFERELEINPYHYYASFYAGKIYSQFLDIDNIIAKWEACTKLQPQIHYVYADLAYWYFLNLEIEKAKDACRRGLRVKPDEPAFYNNLAAIYLHEGQAEKAYEILKKGEKQGKEYLAYLTNQILASIELNRLAEAEKIIALHKSIFAIPIPRLQAEYYLKKGDLDAVQQNLAMIPDSEKLLKLNLQAKYLRAAGKSEEAQKIQQEIENYRGWPTRACLQAKSFELYLPIIFADIENATKQLESLYEECPDYPHYFARRTHLLLRAKKFQVLAEEGRAFLQEGHDHWAVKANVGQALLELNQPQEALKLLQEANQEKSDHREIKSALAKAYKAMGMETEALEMTPPVEVKLRPKDYMRVGILLLIIVVGVPLLYAGAKMLLSGEGEENDTDKQN